MCGRGQEPYCYSLKGSIMMVDQVLQFQFSELIYVWVASYVEILVTLGSISQNVDREMPYQLLKDMTSPSISLHKMGLTQKFMV